MLAAGALTILVISTLGGLMIDYAWREAQWQEVRAALRAAVAAAAPMFSGALDEPDTVLAIQERIAGFAGGLVGDLDIKAEDVDFTYDAGTGVYTIVARGNFPFERIWHGGRDPEAVADTIKIAQDNEQAEVAIAVDVSGNMRSRTPWGENPGDVKTRGYYRKWHMTSRALRRLANKAESAGGGVLLSLVPYAATVNVADTCDPDLDTGNCQGRPTEDKKRYLRILLGDDNLDVASLVAQSDVRNSARKHDVGGHWVAAYHEYGVSSQQGLLQRRFLPSKLLAHGKREWNFEKAFEADQQSTRGLGGERWYFDDVSAENPALHEGGGRWKTGWRDFWNGCVMARWGAPWGKQGRLPPLSLPDHDRLNFNWTPNRHEWPVKVGDVWGATKLHFTAWAPGYPELSPATPIHLSDLPPSRDNLGMGFTAYSYPDARMSFTADQVLEEAMLQLLVDPDAWTAYVDRHNVANHTRFILDNPWGPVVGSGHTTDGGALWCVTQPVLPLTDNMVLFKSRVDPDRRCNDVPPEVKRRDCLEPRDPDAALPRPRPQPPHPYEGYEGRPPHFTHLGLVWALRTLSPQWKDFWGTRDSQDRARPSIECVNGQPANCVPTLKKSIVVIHRGLAWSGEPGAVRNARLFNHTRKAIKAEVTTARWAAPASWNDWCTPQRHSPIQITDTEDLTTKRLNWRPYFRAARAKDEAAFHSAFRTPEAFEDQVHPDGTFIDHSRVARAIMWRPNNMPAGYIQTMVSALDALQPTAWQLFRELDPDVLDTLMDPDNGFFNMERINTGFPIEIAVRPALNGDGGGLMGRPTQFGHMCRFYTPYSVYGQLDDMAYVGYDDDGKPLGPVAGKAPFETSDSLPNVGPTSYARRNANTNPERLVDYDHIRQRLNLWLEKLCEVVAERNIYLRFVVMQTQAGINRIPDGLVACIEKFPDHDLARDIQIANTPTEMENAIVDLISVESEGFRFVN